MKRKHPASAEPTESSGEPAESTESAGEKMPGPPEATASKEVAVPSILLEGDEPKAATCAGPGRKFASANESEGKPPTASQDELPETYNTGRLLLTARDPNCLYAHWDVSAQQQREYNQSSVHHCLVLRVHEGSFEGPVIAEQHLSSESHHVFVPVDSATGKYVAQLGYYPPDRPWQLLAASESVVTSGAQKADQGPAIFATLSSPVETQGSIPLALSLPGALIETPVAAKSGSLLPSHEPPLEMATSNLNPEFPLVRTSLTIQSIGSEPAMPDDEPEQEEFISPWSGVPVRQRGPAWTSSQERALAEFIGRSVIRQKRFGSVEMAALMRGDISWAGVLARSEVSSISGAALSSQSVGPVARAERPGFWLNVNAELVIYGATEPNSTVRIGGRDIRLRPDGTFSFRFTLPDGSYQLPVEAVSIEGEVRRADLEFQRRSAYSGEVKPHPQDPELAPPDAKNLS